MWHVLGKIVSLGLGFSTFLAAFLAAEGSNLVATIFLTGAAFLATVFFATGFLARVSVGFPKKNAPSLVLEEAILGWLTGANPWTAVRATAKRSAVILDMENMVIDDEVCFVGLVFQKIVRSV